MSGARPTSASRPSRSPRRSKRSGSRRRRSRRLCRPLLRRLLRLSRLRPPPSRRAPRRRAPPSRGAPGRIHHRSVDDVAGRSGAGGSGDRAPRLPPLRRRMTACGSPEAMDRMMPSSPIVIAGAGHAGVQAAASLREDGFDGEIVLLSDEKDLPYQRPPLSKAFLKGEMDIHGLPLRAEAYLPRPAHRSEARRSREADRPGGAARRDERRTGDRLRPSHPGDRSATAPARGAGRRTARRLQPAHHRRRDRASASGSAPEARSSSSARASSGSRSRRPQRASGPT